jgi:hypothetical protein
MRRFGENARKIGKQLIAEGWSTGTATRGGLGEQGDRGRLTDRDEG